MLCLFVVQQRIQIYVSEKNIFLKYISAIHVLFFRFAFIIGCHGSLRQSPALYGIHVVSLLISNS